MSSSLLEGIKFVSSESSKRSKKKHKKKKKKHKKRKKKSRRRENESDSGSSSSEEATTTTSSSRMEWMSKPSDNVGRSLFDETSRPINGIVSKPGATRANIYTDKGIVGKYARKLGEGLRNVEREQASLSAQSQASPPQKEPEKMTFKSLPRALPSRQIQQQQQQHVDVSNVGDGGLQWKRKSMKRAKEQAQRENRSLRDVLIDRVGAVETEKLLSNQELLLSELRGVVVSWNSERGFGFIRPSSSSSKEDLFCHTRSITSGQKELSKGTVVKYETRRNSRSGKMEACDVCVVIDKGVNERKKKKRKKIPPLDDESKEREASRASFLYGGSSSQSNTVKVSSSSHPPLKRAKKVITLESLSSLSKNELAARALRARMSGNMEECEKIEEILQNMQETVIVTPLDERGRMISELTNRATATKHENNSAASQLQRMLREEKQESTRSHDLSFVKTYAKNEKVEDKGRAIQPSSDETKKGVSSRDLAMRRAVQAQLKWDTNRARCVFCVGSDAMLRKKRLFIHISENATLQLDGNPLVPGHCRISPRDHVSSMIQADENQFEEVRLIETCLRRMITNAGMGCIMMETVLRSGDNSRFHTYIDFIPVPKRVEQDAPLYFKQALMDSDEQWSQHKKIIDTTKRGLRRCIPKGFAYFHVRWSDGQGFAHIIENRAKFGRTFGLDVITGMLGLDTMSRRRTGNQVTNEDIENFTKRWNTVKNM